MPISRLLCSLGPGPASATFIKHIRFYTKAQGSTPSDWSKEMHGESCWGSWQGWHTVTWWRVISGQSSQVSTTSPIGSCWGLSRSEELSGAAGWVGWDMPAPELQLTQPWERQQRIKHTVTGNENKNVHSEWFVAIPVCLFPVGWHAVWSMDGLQPAPLSALGWTRAGGAEALEASPCPPPKPCSGPCGERKHEMIKDDEEKVKGMKMNCLPHVWQKWYCTGVILTPVRGIFVWVSKQYGTSTHLKCNLDITWPLLSNQNGLWGNAKKWPKFIRMETNMIFLLLKVD